ncbi:hypothetical protein L0668_09980 [Paraglaciecola aquimarina]|uniref:NolW-like domain-containing protein n=1 Tax=Paraglaciecola algarum TaxID=3050085 RepID=A0ABS9D7U2_9ALTE|nr:secretin N-terminal domain-containing protein [Paraglaciecola sp. G1-23]MCF2948435.1 hypothetical protein [Paraglaciecola sp. G1-23]
MTVNRSFLAKPIKIDELEKREAKDSSDNKAATSASFQTESAPSFGGISKLSETTLAPPEFDDVPVSFVADDISLSDFASQLYGDIFKLNYVLAPEIKASQDKVSLSISESISKAELYKIAQTTLALRDVVLLSKDDIIYIQKASAQQQKNEVAVGIGNLINDVPDTTGEITQLVPYIYSESRNISSVMSKLSSAKLTIMGKQKIIIVEGERAEIERALRLIKMLDVPRAYGREIRLLEFVNISPKDAEEQIRKLLDEDGLSRSSTGDYSFVTMPRINTLVAYAANTEIIDRIMYWADKLDVPLAGDEPRFYVFKPSYAKASDLMTSVSTLLGGIKSDRVVEPTSPAQTNDSARNRVTSTSNGSITMSFDETQNALLFHATPAEYKQVLDLLSQLDQLPGQVILDAAIVEVTLSDDVSSGIDWIFDSRGQTGTEGLTANLEPLIGSLNMVGIKGNWQATLTALKSKTDTRVLSKPYLVVQDGMTATLNSGDSIPVLTASVQDVGDNNTVANEVSYRTTGTQVSFTPIINSEGVISLEVSVSVSNSGDGSLTPTITNRSLSTSALSLDGQTIVLGGMIGENTSLGNNGVPLLGDVPILGELFKSRKDNYSRTELLIMITTRIVKDSRDIDEFGKKVSELYSVPLEFN